MSKEMREQIDRVKNWKQFLNENSSPIEIEIEELKKEISRLEDESPESKEIPTLYSRLRRLRETQRNINNSKYWKG